jgi:hypothetical protein
MNYRVEWSSMRILVEFPTAAIARARVCLGVGAPRLGQALKPIGPKH